MITVDDLAKVLYESQNAGNVDLLPARGAKRNSNPRVSAQLDKVTQEITGQSVASLRQAAQEAVQVKGMKAANKLEAATIAAYVDLPTETKAAYRKQAVYVMRRFEVR
ncbi:MAG: hypothetical protein ABFD81_19125 [Syntrophaceae bacterium]